MTEFETIAVRQMEYGSNNFIEVARKLARGAGGQNEFIAVSRGYVDSGGARRYKMNVTMPTDPEVLDFVRSALTEVI